MTNPSSSSSHIALLRGINVGGRHKLPMKDLKGIFEAAGCTQVRTYIQSGNVVFEPAQASLDELPTRIGEAIEAAFGFSVPVVLRSADELRRAVANIPFTDEGLDPKLLQIVFLQQVPTPEQIAGLDPDRSPPDVFSVIGREIFCYHPNGIHRSKLTNAYFDTKLDTISTARNLRTTLKLLEMAEA